MAAQLRAESAKINSELDKFKDEVTNYAVQAQQSTILFSYIEDECTDQSHTKCISEHDKYKLKLGELQRRRFKEFFEIQVECSPLVHHLHQWENPVPVNSEVQQKKANAFMECFRPHALKLLDLAREEVSLMERATKDLQRMANIKI
jgi:hypothetical protein